VNTIIPEGMRFHSRTREVTLIRAGSQKLCNHFGAIIRIPFICRRKRHFRIGTSPALTVGQEAGFAGLCTNTLQKVDKIETIRRVAPGASWGHLRGSYLSFSFSLYFAWELSALAGPALACVRHWPKSFATVFTRKL